VFLGLYYWGFARRVEIGGGPKLALGNVLGTLSAFSLGLPSSWGVFVALPLFAGVIVVALVLLWRRDRALLGFYLTAILVAPALGMWASRFALIYPRYFIVSAAIGLLLAGYVLARLWDAGRAVCMVCVVLLGGFLLGNGMHATRLMRDGRGQYQAALRHIAERTPAGMITVSSDSDFRNFAIVDYHAKAVGSGHTLQYCPGNQLPPDGPQWVLVHRLDDTVPPSAADLDIAGRWHFRLERVFPHAPLSGWEWYVYRNLDPSVLPPVLR